MSDKEKQRYLELEQESDWDALEYLGQFIYEYEDEIQELWRCVLKLNYINNCYECGWCGLEFKQDIYFNNKFKLLKEMGISYER